MVLVTGGTGLVGGRVLLELRRRGEDVRALIRDGSDRTWVERLFQFHAPELYGGIMWVSGDVLDVPSLEDAMRGCDTVIHAAAVVSFHKKDRDMLFKVNTEGTANVVNAALAEGVDRFCHISSTAALGRSFPGEHINEKSSWKTSPLNSQYAISKFQAENEVWRASEEGLNVVVVNPSIVLGSGNPHRSSGSMFSRIRGGLSFYPTGSNGFVTADDVARACCDLLKSESFGERFLLSSNNMTYQSIFSGIAKALDVKVPSTVAQKWMMNLYWFWEAFKEITTGKRALVTRQSIRNASNKVYYDGNKITEKIDFGYADLQAQIDESAQFYLQFPNA